MTEPRPPIHPAPGDWPEPSDAIPDYKSLNENARRECARIRAELARKDAAMSLAISLLGYLDTPEGPAEAKGALVTLRAALEPRKEGGE